LQRHHRKALLVGVQLLFALAVAWFAGRAIQRQWTAIEAANLTVAPGWSWVILSATIVLATYLLLIGVWIFHLRDWGHRVAFLPAARMWFVSNLGRYIPGKIWGLGTLAVMAERRDIPAVAAIGSSILVMLIGIASGLTVILVTGAGVVDAVLREQGITVPRGAVPLTVAFAIAWLAAAPIVLPGLAAVAGRLTRRPPVLPRLPAASVWTIAAASGLSWLLYGLAFQLFAVGILGRNAGGPAAYIAVYTASYLVGLLSLIPGGLVVREAALVIGLLSLELATAPEAALLAVTSRIWITVLEILPGILFLVTGSREVIPGQPTPSDPRP
jgi:hypothetical protein